MSDTFQAVVVAICEAADAIAVSAARQLEEAGHTVTDRHRGGLEDAARQVSALGAAGTTDIVVVVGVCANSQDELQSVLTSPLPVLTGIYSVRRFRQAGGNALGESFVAGRSHSTIVVAVPAKEDAVSLILSLVLPALPALCGTEVVAVVEPEEEDEDEIIAEVVEEDEVATPDSIVSAGGMSLGSSDFGRGVRPASVIPEEDTVLGWKTWVNEHKAEVLTERREDLPNNIDELAPVLQVLHSSGQQAVLKIGRNKMSLWGWPDLQRPTSKVIAVGWGLPFIEVVALHRTGAKTGLAIDEDRALTYKTDVDLAEVTKELTGRAIENTEGTLFASEQGNVWIRRGQAIYRWDGKREFNEGTERQVLTSLILQWSQR